MFICYSGPISIHLISCPFVQVVNPEMPNFRWPLLYHDISLAKEVINLRPEKPSDWETVATKLSDIFSSEEMPILLKGRGCRKRLDLLLKKYRDEDTKGLKQYVTYVFISGQPR